MDYGMIAVGGLIFVWIAIGIGYYLNYSFRHRNDIIWDTIIFETGLRGPSTLQIYGRKNKKTKRLLISYFVIKEVEARKKIELLQELMKIYGGADLFIETTGIGEEIFQRLKIQFGRRVMRWFRFKMGENNHENSIQ